MEDEYNFKPTIKNRSVPVHLEVHQYQRFSFSVCYVRVNLICLSLRQRTPLDVALNKGHNKIADILRGELDVSMV